MNATPIRRDPRAPFSWTAPRLASWAAIFCAGSSTLVGCTTHNCDPSTVDVSPANPDSGVANRTVPLGDGLFRWQSSPDDGPWLDFTGARTFVVTYPKPFAELPQPDCYVSADVNDPQGQGFTRCGDAVAIFTHASVAGITVFNPSCAEFGLQIFATGVLSDADASTDAGAPTSANEPDGA